VPKLQSSLISLKNLGEKASNRRFMDKRKKKWDRVQCSWELMRSIAVLNNKLVFRWKKVSSDNDKRPCPWLLVCSTFASEVNPTKLTSSEEKLG
jgi:hypothetical protein